MSKIVKLPNCSELTGATETITSYGVADSAQRMHMAAAQIQQAPMPKKPDIPMSLTGMEPQMTETTMAIVMPCDAVIEDVITHHVNAANIKTKTIVYMNVDNGEYNTLELTGYFRAHDVFGAVLNLTSQGQRLRPGVSVPKGTILAHTNGANKKGVYTTSLCTSVANMSLKGTIEDGLIVSEDYLDRATPVAMVKREAETGKDRYFVGAYSRNGVFRAFASPDEAIRKDNLVFATRRYDELLDAVNMLDDMIDSVIYETDECVYAPTECKNGRVVDVKVFSAPSSSRIRSTPPTMEEALNVHKDRKTHYCNVLLEAHRKICQREGGRVTLGPEMEELLTYALADKPNDPTRTRQKVSGSVQYTHKANPIDEWYVQIELAWMYDLKYGAKFSDMHGNH